jgi:spermidine/putrescine transport system substrate-binding protein
MTPDLPIEPVASDPVLLRGLTRSRLDRRDFLRMFGAAGAVSVLSACGVSGQAKTQNVSKSAVDKYWSKQKQHGVVNFANWPLYIDVAAHNKGDHPTLDKFTKETGIKVNYYEVIQDNGPFFAKVQPSLQAHQYSGYDMAVISNGIFFTQFEALGYLVPLDQSRMKNFYKYAGDKYKKRPYDPGNVYSMPWQAGFTGIGYDPTKTGREITSWQDLTDPKFQGKIGMFGNNEDLPNCALLAIGVDPAKSTVSDWKKAAAWLNKQKPLVRKYYSQDYISALANGDIWITMAWSGDIFQQNLSGSKLKFAMPKEGALFWIDNMLLLKYAQNPVDAMELMDFYYLPREAASLAEYVNYVSPVPSAQQVVQSDAAKTHGADKQYLDALVHSYAVFPTAQEYASATLGRPLKLSELPTWNRIFEPIYQS